MATGRRRGRAFIYIALILILLLVLVFAVTRLGIGGLPGLTRQPDAQVVELAPTPTAVQDTVDIVVTTQNIQRGQELSEGLLQVVAIPRDEYTDGVFYNTLDEVVGSRSRYDLEARTPLTTALVVPQEGSGSIPAFEIPKGMVAISIPVSKLSSVSYGLQKGDHVNLIASMQMVDLDTDWQTRLPNRTGMVIAPGPIEEGQTNVTALLQSPDEYTVTGSSAMSYLGRIEINPTLNNPVYLLPSEIQRPRLVSQTLIQDVVVLQIGYFPLETPTEETVATEEEQAEAQGNQQEAVEQEPAVTEPEVITLIVSPQDAVTINYLMLSSANLNLVMRSAGDDQKIDTEAVTLQFILDQYRIPIPAKLPYGLDPRVDTTPDLIEPFPNPGTQADQTQE